MDGQLSPGSGGPLVDPDGVVWSIRRRRVDVRVVRRALESHRDVVLLGDNGGFDLRWVAPDQRLALWERVRDNYRGPGGDAHGDYAGYEFVNDTGASLLYLEKSC